MIVRVAWAIALALLLAVTTTIGGWWTVPVGAALWGVARSRHRGAALDAGLASALAWALLLARQALRGPVGLLAAKMAAVMGLSGPALILMTLLYAFLLGWSAARLTAAAAVALTARRRRVPSRG